jgi:uncharacterized protein YndB with AHSA1/START domain
MIKTVAAIVAVLAAAVLALAAFKPDTFHVQRSISIKAPPAKIFALIDNFRNWDAWSPWEKLDPALKRTFSGAASGKGAVYEWEGNRKVGSGRMEITESSPSSRIVIKLDFIKPPEGHNVAEFTLEEQGDSTRVTWTMQGPAPFISKVIQVFLSMDAMIGQNFETGLENMKTVAER